MVPYGLHSHVPQTIVSSADFWLLPCSKPFNSSHGQQDEVWTHRDLKRNPAPAPGWPHLFLSPPCPWSYSQAATGAAGEMGPSCISSLPEIPFHHTSPVFKIDLGGYPDISGPYLLQFPNFQSLFCGSHGQSQDLVLEIVLGRASILDTWQKYGQREWAALWSLLSWSRPTWSF